MKEKILVVDDEKGLRYTFESFLSDEGYEVSLASNYYEALEKISKNSYDLIFADIVMGEKTGIDLLKEIKEKKLNCPVIMITGYPNIKTATEAVRFGAFDYLSKPVKQSKIIRTAKIALEYKRAIEEKERYRKNLEIIFASVKDGIITVDKDLNIIEINEAAKNICHIPEDITSKSLLNLLTQCHGMECINAVKKTLETQEPAELHRLECNSIKCDSQIVSLNISPLIQKEKDICGAVMVIRDETDLIETSRRLLEKGQFHNIIGKSKKMHLIYDLIEKLSPVTTTVLITGKSGTGKELVADALHYKGPRKNRELVKVNCSALPENLLESELFGHVKGSFTGAIKDRIGWFSRADKGTIFLDEIGDISPALQLRLLRVLQNKEFVRVGDSKPKKVDVRVIASTNQDITEKIKNGEFREDLYYRLKVVEIELPPLKDRAEDIPLLIEHFIKIYNKKFNKEIKGVSKNVMKIFLNYSWPGNIRELEHTIEHAFILSNQFLITVSSLPKVLKEFSPPKDIKRDDINEDMRLIIEALEKCNWKKSPAARLLGINRKTIYRKMKKYNIPLKQTDY